MMLMKTWIVNPVSVCCLVLALVTSFLAGCGGSESTVVQPGPDYQLTPDEERMKAEIDAVPPPEY